MNTPDPASDRGHLYLALALVITLLVWNLPVGRTVLYPFRLFATWIHESSHAVLMVITGAGFAHMDIYSDASGLAHPRSGVVAPARAAISSAGYMGTPLFGAALLAWARTQKRMRWALGLVGLLMLGSAILMVRNDFGIAVLAASGLVLLLVSWRAPAKVCGFLVAFLAAQACMNAFLDIRILFSPHLRVNGRVYGRSDAHTLSEVVGGPPWMWASLWLLWSLALFYVALRKRRPRHRSV